MCLRIEQPLSLVSFNSSARASQHPLSIAPGVKYEIQFLYSNIFLYQLFLFFLTCSFLLIFSNFYLFFVSFPVFVHNIGSWHEPKFLSFGNIHDAKINGIRC